MSKYKINFAELDIEDISLIEFSTLDDCKDFLKSLAFNTPNRVILITTNLNDEIIITDNKNMLLKIFENNQLEIYLDLEYIEIFIQDYHSYEDAYAVALDMKSANSELTFNN